MRAIHKVISVFLILVALGASTGMIAHGDPRHHADGDRLSAVQDHGHGAHGSASETAPHERSDAQELACAPAIAHCGGAILRDERLVAAPLAAIVVRAWSFAALDLDGVAPEAETPPPRA